MGVDQFNNTSQLDQFNKRRVGTQVWTISCQQDSLREPIFPSSGGVYSPILDKFDQQCPIQSARLKFGLVLIRYWTLCPSSRYAPRATSADDGIPAPIRMRPHSNDADSLKSIPVAIDVFD